MNASKQLLTAVLLAASAAVSVAPGQHALRPAMDPPDVKIDAPAVIAPPESFFKMIEERISNPRRFGRSRREDATPADEQKPSAEKTAAEMALYRKFYKKYLDVKGMPVAAHAD